MGFLKTTKCQLSGYQDIRRYSVVMHLKTLQGELVELKPRNQYLCWKDQEAFEEGTRGHVGGLEWR